MKFARASTARSGIGPWAAFLLAERPTPTPMFLPELLRVARPALGIEPAERFALGSQGQRRMQQQADGAVGARTDRAETLGGRVRREVEKGGVLGRFALGTAEG